MNDVYITDLESFFPGNPVSNDEIDQYVAQLDRNHQVAKRTTLRNNGIKQRHYAIHPETQENTMSNAEMTAEAIRKLPDWKQATMLACGTSSPDLLFLPIQQWSMVNLADKVLKWAVFRVHVPVVYSH